MKFEHRFRVRAAPPEVARFHASAGSLRAITPLPMRVHHAPDPLGEGDEIAFTMWMGPLPLRWHGRIENVSIEGFDDVQLGGPFRAWRHRHNFVPLAEGATEVYDVVEADLRPHLLWGPVGLAMWLGLPVLFAFRGFRTRQQLEKTKERQR